MKARLKFCATCQDYTLAEACPRCGGKAVQNTPAKFSPEDNYGKYRRQLRQLDAGKKA